MRVYGGVRIVNDPMIFGGRPIIGGHRITVHDIVAYYQAGMSVEELARGYSVTDKEITAALSYYAEHKAAIDREIEEDRQEIASRAAADISPMAQRIRENLDRHRAP